MLLRPVAATSVVVDTVGDELCLLNLDTNDALVLNQTASDIWLLMSDGSAPEEVIRSLARSYQIDESLVRESVLNVVRDLVDRGFIVESE